MKPEYEKVVELPVRSFVTKIVERESRMQLRQAWHFHPEIEICYTRESSGRRFVGNRIMPYHENDLVLLGSNLPHGFTTEMHSYQVVIQFTDDFLGTGFLHKPEVYLIRQLFDRARQGLVFSNETKVEVIRLIEDMIGTDNSMQQLIYLLQILQLMAESSDVTEICSKEYALDFNESNLGRIKLLYDHIMENFKEEARVKEIADKLNISEAAFYKFIKKQTKKTYTEIINEFRINHASKLLMSTEKSISQICFESGYNNVSYFNRKFKDIMHQTPHDFKNNYTLRQV